MVEEVEADFRNRYRHRQRLLCSSHFAIVVFDPNTTKTDCCHKSPGIATQTPDKNSA